MSSDILKLKGHERPITNILIDEGNNLISTSKDSKLIIWDNFISSNEIKCSGSICFIMAVSSNLFIGTADGLFSIYDNNGVLVNSYTDCGPVRFIHFDKHKSVYYILSKKLLKKESVLSVLDCNLSKICDYEFDVEHNKCCFTSDNILICGSVDGKLKFLNYENNSLNLLNIWDLHKSEITGIEEFEGYLITSSYDSCLKILDKNNLQIKSTFKHITSILSFSLNKQKKLIAIGGGPDKMNIAKTNDNGKFDIVLINMLDGEKLFDIDSKHFGPINSICFNENDNKIITGGEDGYIHIWDCNDQWYEKNTLKNLIHERADAKLSLQEAITTLDNTRSGKETKNKRRNIKKRINKLELKIDDYNKEIMQFSVLHSLNKFENLKL